MDSLFDGKVCIKCGSWKLKSEYYKHNKSGDGLFPYCKPCQRTYASDRVKAKYGSHKGFYDANKEKCLSRQKKYYAADPVRHKAIRKASRIRTRDQGIARKARRRASELNAQGTFTRQEWKDLCEKYGNRCLACGESKPLTADHVIPLSKGGKNTIDNIQPLCGSCNSRKFVDTTDYRPSAKAE